MKKTIAMISALAMTAALVMPFTAAADEEAVHLEKLTAIPADANYENFMEKIGAQSFTYNQLPKTIDVTGEVYLIIAVDLQREVIRAC